MITRVEERTPYVIVSFQECERMNVLMSEIKRSLKELHLGLKVKKWRRYTLFIILHHSIPYILIDIDTAYLELKLHNHLEPEH